MKHAWLVLSLISFTATAQQPTKALVLGPQQKVEGLAQIDYAERWWQWLMRLPDGVRAFQDPSGAQCGMNQSGQVWFLAGTEGTAKVKRQCDLPGGRFIFFPVIAMIRSSAPGKVLDCRRARAQVHGNNDHLAEASVEIDSVMVANVLTHRIRSTRCFDAYAKAGYMEHSEDYLPAATEGYWLMLSPLSPGPHRLVVHARYDNPGKPGGDMEQAFEYEMWVAPAERKFP